jgi:hypothetical protein
MKGRRETMRNARDAQGAHLLAALDGWRQRILGRVPALAQVVALVALAGVAAFAVGRASAPEAFAMQPAHVALPARAQLVRREEYVDAREQRWYYVVPGQTHAGLTAFYQARLANEGWTCFRAMTSTSITRDGKSYTGSSVYITALRGDMKAQISTADQAYGEFLLQHDLPASAIGLEISLEVSEKPVCV